MFTTQFDDCVLEGETITCEVDGIIYTATLELDDAVKPTDYDCYSPNQIAAWEGQDWFFGGIVISASKHGIKIDDCLTALGGIDCNSGGNEMLMEHANEMLPDAIVEAKIYIARMIASLQS